jgi:short subunit fatty acids transporter
MLATASKPLVRLVDRYLPDPYIFVLILTIVVFVGRRRLRGPVADGRGHHVGRRLLVAC